MRAPPAEAWGRTPRQMVFLARSFGRHALELGNAIPERPLFFLKSLSALVGPGEAVVLPAESAEVHHEAEVAVWVGAPLTRATPEEAAGAIEAWTVLNDVTARDVQRADGGRFTRAKCFDTFCPLCPQAVSPAALGDWRAARVQGWRNGALAQDAPLSDLLYSPAEALSAISQVMTLRPGDLVSLGTPAGVGPLAAGDSFEVRLVGGGGEALLSLVNPVVAAR
ncbi:MAG: fumarylacetoacetate hydrolase family protein [Deltaproteobacteria bacterium]|nr:fumarylacetoacetate hydrolase family protein [Deltaproteobacteria bacterium]